MSVSLSFASVICRDFAALSDFYQRTFALPSVDALSSDYFRGLSIGNTILGFSAPAAFSLLNIPEVEPPSPPTSFWTFEADSRGDVDTLTEGAIANGAVCLRKPAETYYGAWQSVLSDPEGNVFRINRLG